jgi:hypothetical protein
VPRLSPAAQARILYLHRKYKKSYISEGLRRDEAQIDQFTARQLADALKRRGVAEKVLQDAMKEIAQSS